MKLWVFIDFAWFSWMGMCWSSKTMQCNIQRRQSQKTLWGIVWIASKPNMFLKKDAKGAWGDFLRGIVVEREHKRQCNSCFIPVHSQRLHHRMKQHHHIHFQCCWRLWVVVIVILCNHHDIVQCKSKGVTFIVLWIPVKLREQSFFSLRTILLILFTCGVWPWLTPSKDSVIISWVLLTPPLSI